MKKVGFAKMHCSLARALDRMGDWWTPLIVRDVYLGVNRFDDLVADLGVSRNLLTTRLAGLVEAGILHRHLYRPRPVRYEYLLTEAGRDLIPAILALTAWGDRWTATAAGPPMLVRHECCGQVIEATVCCPRCAATLVAEDVTILPGPGGAAVDGTRVLAKRLVDRQ